jgi:hypothetical protein
MLFAKLTVEPVKFTEPVIERLPLKLVGPVTINELKVGLPNCFTKVTP